MSEMINAHINFVGKLDGRGQFRDLGAGLYGKIIIKWIFK
jgi:hypothetical protein